MKVNEGVSGFGEFGDIWELVIEIFMVCCW